MLYISVNCKKNIIKLYFFLSYTLLFYQIADYACLYTSRASNLGNVSPEKPYRAGRDILPHDIDRPLYKN